MSSFETRRHLVDWNNGSWLAHDQAMNNNQSPPMTSSMTAIDLQTLLASMPPETLTSMANMNTTTANMKPQSQSMPDLSHLMMTQEMMMALLQMQQQPMMFSTFNQFGLPPLPYGLPALPTQAPFSFMPNLQTPPRPSLSALPSPVPSQQPEIRPRAFSSAATLQHHKDMEKRRKRSRTEDSKPVLMRPRTTSVLRNLVEADDDIVSSQPPIPTSQEEEKIRMDVARVLNSCPPPTVATPAVIEMSGGQQLRKIIRDQDLPETVGPDSPFRHHPKYQKKARDDHTDMVEKMEALTAFCVVNGVWPNKCSPDDKSSDSGYISAESPKKSFSDIMDTAIRELVTAE